MLNAKQIIDEGLLLLEHTQGKPAQVGYDITLKAVNKIGNRIGYNVFKEGRIGKVLKDRTELTTYTPYPLVSLEGAHGWLLYPGTYDITFNEGCKIPGNLVGLIRQRSSLLRNGTVLHSSVFDPGYHCDFMGTVMVVNETIFIEENARVAQIYFHECDEVQQEDLYSGQWQGGLNDRPTRNKI
jgi:deoxycytidine triphosphate deaminase